MQVIENKQDSGITVAIDDKHFVNCRFKNCKLIYSGGDYAWTETTFENCEVTLAGAAQRTLNLLGSFGMVKGSTLPDAVKRAAVRPPEVN